MDPIEPSTPTLNLSVSSTRPLHREVVANGDFSLAASFNTRLPACLEPHPAKIAILSYWFMNLAVFSISILVEVTGLRNNRLCGGKEVAVSFSTKISACCEDAVDLVRLVPLDTLSSKNYLFSAVGESPRKPAQRLARPGSNGPD